MPHAEFGQDPLRNDAVHKEQKTDTHRDVCMHTKIQLIYKIIINNYETLTISALTTSTITAITTIFSILLSTYHKLLKLG